MKFVTRQMPMIPIYPLEDILRVPNGELDYFSWRFITHVAFCLSFSHIALLGRLSRLIVPNLLSCPFSTWISDPPHIQDLTHSFFSTFSPSPWNPSLSLPSIRTTLKFYPFFSANLEFRPILTETSETHVHFSLHAPLLPPINFF